MRHCILFFMVCIAINATARNVGYSSKISFRISKNKTKITENSKNIQSNAKATELPILNVVPNTIEFIDIRKQQHY